MKRELRASQLVGNGGVGAVIDMGDESFVVTDIAEWRKGGAISLPRLSERLGRPLHSPPVTGENGQGGAVKIKRFPGALFCTSCRALTEKWNEGANGRADGGRPHCRECGARESLAPMRFVTACPHGHLADIPWHRWAHSGGSSGTGRPCGKLWFRVDERSGVGGLQSLYVECSCGSLRDLEQLPAKSSMRSIGQTCGGSQPWHMERTECLEQLVVLQRGATNLHYSDLVTALDLGDSTVAVVSPTGNGSLGRLEASDNFQWLREFLQETPTQGSHVNAGAERIAKAVCGEFPDLDIATVIEAARGASTIEDLGATTGSVLPEEILAEEWAFLVSEKARAVTEPALVCREVPPPRFRHNEQPFSRILLLDRLREVRAMPSFSRVDPGKQRVPVDIGRLSGYSAWYPAVEVYGEGIFLAFDETFIARWEDRLQREAIGVVKEYEQLEQIRVDEKFWFLPAISPRFIAVHTFAHLLMRQLVFECGYSSSALRERIWADPTRPSAGVLIYTADGDSEGALGGLVRQGQRDRLGDLILMCLEKGAWCSADPVCTETQGQGLGGFNHAACHACSLVPETSCVYANTLLNRILVVGRDRLVPGLLEGL